MTAGATETTIGVQLRQAIIRARVARGEKPSFEAAGRIGGADVTIGINNGKPTLGVSKSF